MNYSEDDYEEKDYDAFDDNSEKYQNSIALEPTYLPTMPFDVTNFDETLLVFRAYLDIYKIIQCLYGVENIDNFSGISIDSIRENIWMELSQLKANVGDSFWEDKCDDLLSSNENLKNQITNLNARLNEFKKSEHELVKEIEHMKNEVRVASGKLGRDYVEKLAREHAQQNTKSNLQI